jgi:MoaA/NifB/PqqE/SkfB family radical SAM enzyme
MSEELFEDILLQLSQLRYIGLVALFSNNEPFLDRRIFSFAEKTREMLPHCFIYIMSNGTLLSTDDVREITKYTDLLVIDNYNDNYELLSHVQKIYDFCAENPDIRQKVKIQKRIVNQRLTSRGGNSPNKKISGPLHGITCLNPFEQFIVRPTGEISLCCCDAWGQYTLGDLSKESIMDVWHGKKFNSVREKILMGREQLMLCDACDMLGNANVMPDGKHLTYHWDHLTQL